jgi:hypothetical protein
MHRGDESPKGATRRDNVVVLLPVRHMQGSRVSQGSNLAMATESLRGSDMICVRELADMRSAGKKHTVLDVREASWKALCIFRWRRFRRRPTTSRRINCWWSFVIMALAARWSSTFFEAPALTTQSTSTAASMLGLARSTNRCGATDSVRPKGNCYHAVD